MGRWAGSGKITCESQLAIDVRRWHRTGHIGSGMWFSCSWTRDGEPCGNIHAQASKYSVTLAYRIRQFDGDWESVRQTVPIVWTGCPFGGERPWFKCVTYADGVYCGRRVAKLYAAGRLFACRHCYRLAFSSQHESASYRGIAQAQKIRVRLGGSGSLDEPFPSKPKGMHWRTYERLEARADAAEASSDAAFIEWLMRRLPALVS
jgi:hypothetical protein